LTERKAYYNYKKWIKIIAIVNVNKTVVQQLQFEIVSVHFCRPLFCSWNSPWRSKAEVWPKMGKWELPDCPRHHDCFIHTHR